MKTIAEALELRGRTFGAFELAELAETEEITRQLTFVVVGGTGVRHELEQQAAEQAHLTDEQQRGVPTSA